MALPKKAAATAAAKKPVFPARATGAKRSTPVRTDRKVLARCIDDPDKIRWGRSTTGSAQIALTFKLATGGTMEWIGSLAGEKSAEITARALRNCGWNTNSLRVLTGINDNEVELDIGWEEWEGKTRQRVRWVNKPGGGKMVFKESLAEDELDDLDAHLEGIIAASVE